MHRPGGNAGRCILVARGETATTLGRPMERPGTFPATDPTTWVDRHGDYLYRYARARVHDPDATEELVQEALLAALAARDRFQGRATERSWLTAILKRKVIDWLREKVRRRARERPLPDRWAEGLFTRWGKWKVSPVHWRPDDPGREMTRREFREVLAACLGNLPVRLRQAFVLRHMEEETPEAVCRSVGATSANLWVMLHRARLLWRCLTVNWFGDEAADS